MYTETIKIGLIDDSSIIRFLTRAKLSQHTNPKFEIVLEAPSPVGMESFKAKFEDPDVFLVDVNMPFMNGIDSIPHLKKLYPNSQIIMYTDDLDSDKISRALQLGASDYISKSINDRILIERVEQIVFNNMKQLKIDNPAKTNHYAFEIEFA
ncbi:response regulator transcription factor [Sphingobacterium sp. GVS05A]|uniref:response regulator n=1 Tax=Sphingobacterium sp. GVS05A TaxID=2862679 RepID=UPI001CBBBD29|nr:response regulator transcription factor [Sphingobacterium sp. GVS05A]